MIRVSSKPSRCTELLVDPERSSRSAASDIDLAGRTSNELDHITELVGTVCDVVVEPDGIKFNYASIEASPMRYAIRLLRDVQGFARCRR